MNSGATVHAIQADGKKHDYMCPLVDAKRGFKSAVVRLGVMKD